MKTVDANFNEIPDDPDAIADTWEGRVMRMFAEADAYAENFPPTGKCPKHGLDAPLDKRETLRTQQAVYAGCTRCPGGAEWEQKRAEDELCSQMVRAGVPQNLLKARLENWQHSTEAEATYPEKCREFIQVRRGFLLLLGELGTGKSHLAAAACRQFKSAFFVTQSELLRRLRDTYQDKHAEDPVDRAQDASLFVLDECGLSGGGKDEQPMLHDILNHRYAQRKPTIITGNLSFEQLAGVVGDRMQDRLRESAFAILTFGGDSRRRDARDNYFDAGWMPTSAAINPSDYL